MIGLISETDKLHDISKNFFELIVSKTLNDIFIPSSAYIEYELVLKSKGIGEVDILKDIIHFQNIENIKEVPLDSFIIASASNLRKLYNVTYFDSLHCASALLTDGTMISTDKEYKKILNLKTIDPKSFI